MWCGFFLKIFRWRRQKPLCTSQSFSRYCKCIAIYCARQRSFLSVLLINLRHFWIRKKNKSLILLVIQHCKMAIKYMYSVYEYSSWSTYTQELWNSSSETFLRRFFNESRTQSALASQKLSRSAETSEGNSQYLCGQLKWLVMVIKVISNSVSTCTLYKLFDWLIWITLCL